ncbi:abasic site processing protein YMR114C isoform X2 [Andrographis paniculata]|uniref:abasic site processing protein YMR114C isoform X2 n=1 Tax=Andrographis paniculata TaxID=175694 RepID=UPI0021E9241B|nr:abasic site processing protein YMR114C isoform X2 [Andrographis paniculata]
MCGRARCTLRPDDFTRACRLDARSVRHLHMDQFRPSYNVAPGFNVPVVRRDEEGGDGNGVVLHCMKWGLVPSFTKKSEKPDHFRMFNARSESLREKASFRRLLPKNRCLVSVEGGNYVHIHNYHNFVIIIIFGMAPWMPVVLGNKESIDYWLNDSSSSNHDKLLKPYEDTDLAWYPVTTAMGKLSFDGPECIKEVQVRKEETKSISQFFSRKESCAPQQPKHEITTKDEPVEANEPTRIKEEDEGQFTLEDIGIKDELIENINQDSVKQECGTQEVHASLSPHKSDKRGRGEFSGDQGKQHGNETEKHRVSKRSKGANDKQPTLFSYFGRR